MLKKNIKILIIISNLGLAGMEMIVFNLVKNLDKHQFTVVICCLDRLGVLGEELKKIGFKCYIMQRKPNTDFLLPFKIAKLIKQEKIDFIHAHNSTSWFYGVIAAKMTRKAIIVTRHGLEQKKNLKISIRSKILSLCTMKVVVVSNELKEYSNKIEKINIKKIRVILNGIQIEKYQNIRINIPNKKKELGLDINDLIIGTISNVTPVKNHQFLIKAMPKLLKKFPNAKLIIVGSLSLGMTSLVERLKSLCNRLEIGDKVFFLGSRRDTPELMPIFDIFVNSSLTEGISLSLLEAMAAGTPIVATNVGGTPEIVINGRTGILVSCNNTDQLANALIKILADKEEASIMAKEGLRRVQKLFTLEAMLNNYEHLYAEIAAPIIKKNCITSFNYHGFQK